jgi:hypothetical protein
MNPVCIAVPPDNPVYIVPPSVTRLTVEVVGFGRFHVNMGPGEMFNVIVGNAGNVGFDSADLKFKREAEYPETRSIACASCRSNNVRLRWTCPQCLITHFCSRKCRTKSTKRHQRWCKRFREDVFEHQKCLAEFLQVRIHIPNVLANMIQSYLPTRRAGFYSHGAAKDNSPLYLFTSLEGDPRVATHMLESGPPQLPWRDWLFSGVTEETDSKILN